MLDEQAGFVVDLAELLALLPLHADHRRRIERQAGIPVAERFKRMREVVEQLDLLVIEISDLVQELLQAGALGLQALELRLHFRLGNLQSLDRSRHLGDGRPDTVERRAPSARVVRGLGGILPCLRRLLLGLARLLGGRTRLRGGVTDLGHRVGCAVHVAPDEISADAGQGTDGP